MGTLLLAAAKIVVYSLAGACGILLVGGAVKMVVTEPGDKCVDAGLKLSQPFIGSATLRLGNVGATGDLAKGRRDLSRQG